eukprot:6711304-Pyramimonas_sp.AAC.1
MRQSALGQTDDNKEGQRLWFVQRITALLDRPSEPLFRVLSTSTSSDRRELHALLLAGVDNPASDPKV